MNPRLLVGVSLIPSILLVLAALFELATNQNLKRFATDLATFLFVYLPILVHIPLWVGAYRLFRHDQGGRWLQVSLFPVLLVALWLGPFALMITGPFIAADALAWWVGRRLCAVNAAPLPALPDT